MSDVLALTVSQPYASLIADGKKFVENRRWATSHRGLVAIHAGRGRQYLNPTELAAFPTGCVLAVGNLVSCAPLDALFRQSRCRTIGGTALTVGEVLDHRYTEGPWCWIFSDVRKLKTPLPARGAQGLWPWRGPRWEELCADDSPWFEPAGGPGGAA